MQKQRGQERRTFWCHLDNTFKFKMLADKLSKTFFWLMIGIYEKCKSQAESSAQIESDWTFREGVSFLKSNISCIKQSNLLLHLLRTENCLLRSFRTVECSSL